MDELFAELHQLDIRVSVEDGRLRLSAPKGVVTLELREKIAANKEEIIRFLQKANSTHPDKIDSGASLKILPISRNADLPLSYSQMRLWFLDQLDPGNATYSIPLAIQFKGNLDQEALRKSLNEIYRRHESLRTTFSKTPDGSPVQVIQPYTTLELTLRDLSNVPDDQKEIQANQILVQQARTSFDLARGPLFYAQLIRLDAQNHWLFLNMHHIISDGWSTGIFFGEMGKLYQAFSAGQPNPLEGLPVQYADYAAWQRRALGPQTLLPHLNYWTQKLKGPLPLLDLPVDHPHGKTQTSNGTLLKFVLPSELTAQLKTAANQQGVTLFSYLLTAFYILLYRYTGQEDLIVGTANANRNQQEVEKLIGFFVNTLALRNQLSGSMTFTDLLKQTQDLSLEAFEHRELPFENVVEALHPDRNSGRSPVFQVMFILQNTPFQKVTFNDLEISQIIIDNKTSKYDLTLTVWEDAEGLTCLFEYNTDIFEAPTIHRMVGHYRTLLENAIRQPQQSIDSLAILSADERKLILETWNDTYQPVPSNQTVAQLFEQQVNRTPSATAVADEQNQISYLELNQRANQLANYLHKLNVAPESLVGISLNRSIDMVISLLAIQKAGAAYLPLDPNFPADRLAYMLEDSGASVVISHSTLANHRSNSSTRVICLDLEADAIASEPKTPIPSETQDPNHLAYVLYTSGSTGKPKGVQVLQRNLVNFLASMQKRPGISDQDVLLSVTTLSFDIAGLEIYLPLISGAKLVLVSSQTAADGQKLKQALEQSQATFMQATPATWRLLLMSGWQGSSALKILCGGEALPPELASSLLERCASLWNMYGPTESTIWSTLEQITSVNQPITIGRPIANTFIYVLDKLKQPVPIGAPGELYIGGEGVARGYLNRPELTAEKFVANPFLPDSKQPMYRTGDLARFLPDGRIDFLGRIDHQVKIRGFRIELGEIESILALYPAVKQAVVIAREDTPGDKRLVAYIQSTKAEITPGELIQHLHGKLPDYMIPSNYVFLETFPLTPNGKIDRRALPAPETTRPDLATHFIEPRNEIEQRLAAIWQTALKVEKVGVNDNFFELGGHSLLVVQIHQQICQEFNTNLTIAQIFQYPTIQSLAQYLSPSSQEETTDAQQRVLARTMMQRKALERQGKIHNATESSES
jgi:amino acid adenylation domain-containing protein